MTKGGIHRGKKKAKEGQEGDGAGVQVAVRAVVEQASTADALSAPEKKFVERALVKGVNQSQFGSEMLERQHVAQALQESLVRLGITPEFLADRLKDGLEADDTKFFAYQGTVVDSRKAPSWTSRHRYLESALRLLGMGARSDSPKVGPNFFMYKSHLKDDQLKVEPPKDELTERRLFAARAKNRSHA